MKAKIILKKGFIKHLNFWNIVKYISILILFVFLVYPLFSIFSRSFFNSAGDFTLKYYKTFLTKAYYYTTLTHSLKVSFFTTVLAVMVGVSWITTINELISSIMLYSGKTATISVAIYTEVFRASYGTAAALASILTIATILSLLLFSWVTKGKGSVI